MEHPGFLERLLQPVVRRAGSRGRLVTAVNASGIGLNVVAGDQYVAVVLPSRMFRGEVERRGIAPQVLSRAVEDSGTVTSVLVPWNTCGAYISGVLGVSTAAYFPYRFFNLLSPVLDVVFGYVGRGPHDHRREARRRPAAGTGTGASPRSSCSSTTCARSSRSSASRPAPSSKVPSAAPTGTVPPRSPVTPGETSVSSPASVSVAAEAGVRGEGGFPFGPVPQ